jgi:hypothetical protein
MNKMLCKTVDEIDVAQDKGPVTESCDLCRYSSFKNKRKLKKLVNDN